MFCYSDLHAWPDFCRKCNFLCGCQPARIYATLGPASQCNVCLGKTTHAKINNHLNENFNFEKIVHKEIVHEKKSVTVFNCDLCDKNFKKLSMLTKHMKIHNDVTPIKKCDKSVTGFNCDLCDKIFKTSSMLSKHMKIHNDVTPIKKCDNVVTPIHISLNDCLKSFQAGVLGKLDTEKNIYIPIRPRKRKRKNSNDINSRNIRHKPLSDDDDDGDDQACDNNDDGGGGEDKIDGRTTKRKTHICEFCQIDFDEKVKKKN